MGRMSEYLADQERRELRRSPRLTVAFRGEFFTKEVIARIGKGSAAMLSRFGAFTMTTARQSIRTRPKASPEGQPPSGHTGLLKHRIFFGADFTNETNVTVVIGPEAVGPALAPATLEHGGTIARHANLRRRERNIGDGGEIELDGPPSRSTKAVRAWNGKVYAVTYVRIRSAAQARRANNLNAALYGPEYFAAKDVGARPYMQPAFEKELALAPEMLTQELEHELLAS